MWAVPEEGGFPAADLEEMNWHTFAVDPRTPQQTLTVHQCKDKGSNFFSQEQILQLLQFRLEGYFIPSIVVANIMVGVDVIELRCGRPTPEK